MLRWNLLLRKLFASPPPVRKCTKHSVRLTLELLEGRVLLSADPLMQAVTTASPPLAAQRSSPTAGASLDPSGDTDGSGTINGDVTGQFAVGATINFINGVISGGLSGSCTATGNIMGYPPYAGPLTINGTLGDGTTFSINAGFEASAGGGIFNGTITQFSGTTSDGDTITGSGSFQGTLDGNNNITGGTFNISINVADPPAGVYTWNPQGGSKAANAPQNWKLNDVQQGAGGTLPGDNPADIVEFDGSVSNAPIEWNKNFNFSTMRLGPSSGGAAYTGQQTIDTAVTVELTGANGPSLSTNQTSSNLKLDFLDSTSKFQIDANANITNMTLTALNRNAQFIINGGTTTIGASSSYKETIGVNFSVERGASLLDYSYCALQFTNNNLPINVYGTMSVYYSSTPGSTIINNNGCSGDYLNVSGGTLNYWGHSGVTDTFTVPVFIQKGGTFALTSVSGSSQGKLIVKDSSNYLFPNGSKESVYMQDASYVQLSQSSMLECDNDYYQANGTLETTDKTTCTLQDGSQGQGTATIASGELWIDTLSDGSYGELDVNAATLNFGGMLGVAIQGYTPSPGQIGTSDKLKVSGVFNLSPQGSTSLTVYDYGTVVGGDNWIVIYASNITSNTNTIDFNSKTSNPPQNFNYWPNLPKQGQYEITI